MHTSLPAVLPDHLPDYAPGRITVVAPDAWPLDGPTERLGVRAQLPRYALDVLTLRTDIDPDRVRWLTERVATRPLHSRHVHLVTHLGRLYVVDGHHALAAHLITGTQRLPVRYVRPVRGASSDAWPAAVPASVPAVS